MTNFDSNLSSFIEVLTVELSMRFIWTATDTTG
jgi:hypothetical protein